MAKEKMAASEAAAAGPRPVHVSVIAVPLADEKLTKRVLKLTKKAAKKKQIKRGVKEVIKAVRKKTLGTKLTKTTTVRPENALRRVCIIAGDISPIDVITPLPVLCEDNDIPYVYVPSKEELGAAGLTKRPTSCMLILPKPVKGGEEDAEFDQAYAEAVKRVKAVQPVF